MKSLPILFLIGAIITLMYSSSQYAMAATSCSGGGGHPKLCVWEGSVFRQGRCSLSNPGINLFANGNGNWLADVFSSGSSDSFGVAIDLRDAHNVVLYTIPTFWSPTIGSASWHAHISFPAHLFDSIDNARISYMHC